MFKRILSAALVFGMAALAPPVLAQQNCAPRDIIVDQLTEKFGEVSQGGGIQANSQFFEVWSSRITGTWSIVVTHASGMTCVLATGHTWTENPGFELAFDPAA